MSQVWLIGDPVAHSLSPAMHNAAFAALGLPHRYEAREVKAEQLAATLERVLGDAVLARRLGAAARRRAEERFTLARQVDRLLALWSGVVDEAER